jgi:hypothetical protein
MPHHNQLEYDLLINANDRLTLWLKDTRMRCEVVDLHPTDTLSLVLTSLFYTLTRLLIVNEIKESTFHDMIREAYDRFTSEKDSEKGKT